jgi:hypothetical protein
MLTIRIRATDRARRRPRAGKGVESEALFWWFTSTTHRFSKMDGFAEKCGLRAALATVSLPCAGNGSTFDGYFRPISAQMAFTIP